MAKELLDEIGKNDKIDVSKLSPREIKELQISRWRARTDLLYLAKNVLEKQDVTEEFNGPLINLLQKFPKPRTKEEAVEKDKFLNGSWIYTPVQPNMELLQGSRRRLILDFRGSWKCLDKKQLVRKSNGAYITVDKLQVGDLIAATKTEDSLEEAFVPVLGIEHFNQPGYEITFRSGRVLTVSNNHPFRTILGWKNAEDLKPKDRIALQAHAEEPKDAKFLPDAELLGWLLGDGSISSGNCVITSHTESHRKHIIKICEEIGLTASESKDKKGVAICGYRPRLRELNLYGCTSYTKFIPEVIFTANNDSIKKFLYGIYMTDGCLCKSGLQYTSVSKDLAEGVQKLLLRLNIVSILKPHNFRYKGRLGTKYDVNVEDQMMIKRFLSLVPWDKQSTWKGYDRQYNPNINTVPKEWRELFPKYFFARGEKPQWLKDKWNVNPKNPERTKSLSTYNGNKAFMTDVGIACNNEFLKFLGSDKIFWDFVVKIEPIGEIETIGVETSSKTICVDDIITHNTTLNCECHSIQWLLNYPQACLAIFQYKLEKAETILKSIKEHFQFNGKFRALFPELCPPSDKVYDYGTKAHFDIWDIEHKRRSTRREKSVMAASLDAGLAGYHFEICKYSDVVEPENTETLDQCMKTIDKFGKAEYLLIGLGYWIDVEGTRYHFGDLYGNILGRREKQLKRSGKSEWDVYCRGIFMPDMDPKDRKYVPEELALPDKKDEKGLPIPSFPSVLAGRFGSVEKLLLNEEEDPTNFSAQLRNRPIGGRGGVPDFPIVEKEGNYERPACTPKFEYDNMAKSYSILSVDFAETVSERANWTVFAHATIDRIGRTYVDMIIREKWQPSESVAALIKLCNSLRPTYLVMEEVNFTRGLRVAMEREWQLNPSNYKPSIRWTKRPANKEKEERIRLTLQQPYKTGTLRFVKEKITEPAWNGLIQELREFPRSTSDDILDAISDIFDTRDWFGKEYGKSTVPNEFINILDDPSAQAEFLYATGNIPMETNPSPASTYGSFVSPDDLVESFYSKFR